MKKLRAFKTMITNGFRSIWRNKGMGLVSIATIFAVMLLVGAILLTVLNINGFVQRVNASLDKVVFYLYDETTVEETENLLEELSYREEVAQIKYVSKEQAIIVAQDMFGDDNFIKSGIEKNPLPASIIIELNEIKDAEKIVEDYSSNKNIEEVRYYQELIQKVVRIDKAIKIGGFFAFIVIVLLSIFVISNIIKVAISSRGAEIEIMKYVGASDSFIKGPFIIEGLFYSIVGSALSFGALWVLYNKFIDVYGNSIYEYLSFEVVPMNDIYLDMLVIFLAIGIGIGSIGSITSIRKYLKV